MDSDLYIIDVTAKLDVKVRDKVAKVAADLKEIKKAEPRIRCIVLRGGAVVDILLGVEPNDFDLFYSFEENGKTVKGCRCDEVRAGASKASLSYFDKDKIDLENSYEKEPTAEPIVRTCGFISFHVDTFSMFCIDEGGHVWANVEAWGHFQDRIYEIRYEGLLPWAYFPREKDSNNYYYSLLHGIVRGIGYIGKRDLVSGAKFKLLVAHTPYFLRMSTEQTDLSRVRRYAKAKIGLYKSAEPVIRSLGLDNEEEVCNCFKSLLQ